MSYINSHKEITFTCENTAINNDLLYLLAYGHKAKICKYFLRIPYGILLLRGCSDQELLFLMPNNVKRRLGLPMTRVARRGLRSRKYKECRKRKLVQCYAYEWIEQAVEKQFGKMFNKTINNMAEVGEIANNGQN